MGALGVIYNLGSDIDVGQQSDQDRLAARMQAARWDNTGEPVYNVPVALSIMVFFALCAQCASTLVIIRRETNSWRWPVFTFVYMTALAYVAAPGDLPDRHAASEHLIVLAGMIPFGEFAQATRTMNFDAQTIAVLGIVTLAAVYLVRASWRSLVRRKAAACGACGSCQAASSKEPEVVEIGVGARRDSPEARRPGV